MSTSNTASMLHAIAEELGCDPELVGAVRKELKLRKRDDIKHAVQERLSQQSADDAPTAADDDTPAPKKERKPGLTLSQRRALLRLLDSDVTPATGFKALPYEKLVDVGYADRVVLDENGDDVTNDAGIGIYTLTPVGRQRAESINPGYASWSAGESVAGDENRPVAGTHREARAAALAAKAVEDAAKAEAEAEAKDADAETSDEKVAIEA